MLSPLLGAYRQKLARSETSGLDQNRSDGRGRNAAGAGGRSAPEGVKPCAFCRLGTQAYTHARVAAGTACGRGSRHT
jgi:hypothetical protein